MFLIKGLELLNGQKIDFALDHHQDLIIRGSNGLGKSLFLKTLANLFPAKYETFKYQEKPLTQWNPEIYRSLVMYVHPTMPRENMLTEDYLSIPLKLAQYKGWCYPVDTSYYTDRWEMTGKDIRHLSQGQRQLLSLLLAINLKAKVLLLDEPTSHLDHKRTQEAMKLVLEWKERTNGSILMITHDLEDSKLLHCPEILLNQLFVN